MSGTALPAIAIAYALVAICCAAWAIFQKSDKLWWSLACLVLSISALNACAEQPAAMKRFPFAWSAAILVILFVLSYRSVCRRLIERTGLRADFAKEGYAFLPQFYIGCGAIYLVAIVHSGGDEKSPLALFAFVALVCAIHAPGFAYGTSRVREFAAPRGLLSPHARPEITWRVIAAVAGMLVAPIIILAWPLKALTDDDYRLVSVDTVMAAVIVSLMVISRSKP